MFKVVASLFPTSTS